MGLSKTAAWQVRDVWQGTTFSTAKATDVSSLVTKMVPAYGVVLLVLGAGGWTLN